MIGAIYVESAERARFFTPLDSVVSRVVASVSRVAFDVNHLYPTVPSRVFLSESFVATLTNFRILARLPCSCGDVLTIIGLVARTSVTGGPLHPEVEEGYPPPAARFGIAK